MTSKFQKKDTAFLSDFLPDNLTAEERTRCAQTLGKTQVAIGRVLDWAAHFTALDWPRDTALICDNNTWKAAAEHISQSLVDCGFRVTLLNLGSSPKPTTELAEYIVSHTASCAALIAVGSGSLNDLTKHAAFLSGKPYTVCGTAASMNGYLSANAAILAHGHKKSLPSRLPRAALFDLDVLEAAPRRLQAAGLGDSICRSTAQVDWLISHHLIGTPYDELPFKLLAPYETALLAGDRHALIQTLLLSGLGMALANGSYPASQAEHLLSHFMEMRYPDIAHNTLHGEQIAVTTLFISELQNALFSTKNASKTHKKVHSDEKLLLFFSGGSGREVLAEWHAKIAHKPKEISDLLCKEYTRVHVPTSVLRTSLEKSGSPLHYSDLGLSEAQWLETVEYAKYIRNRFTCLDLI